MFTQHIEKQRNVNTLNQNDINNSANNANVRENELTYQFQRWGQNHTVRILESSEGIRLKPSDTLVPTDSMKPNTMMLQHNVGY